MVALISMLKISFSNIKKNKMSCVLTGSIFMLAALIFSIAIAMFSMSKEPFEKTFDKLNVSHTLLYYSEEANNNADIQQFWDKCELVESTIHFDMIYLDGKPRVDGESIDMYLIAAEVPSDNFYQDKLEVVEGESKNSPEENEVWISTAFASDNSISVGDVIGLPGKDGLYDYEVSAIVVDPHYSVGTNNPTRIWVRDGELEKNFTEKCGSLLGIRYKEYSEKAELSEWKEMEEYIGGNFVGSKKEYSSLVTAYTSRYKNIGLVMIALSFIIVLFSIVTLSFTISRTILNDYRLIGVYKAQGFSPWQVIGIYLLNYMLLTVVFVPLGIIISFPIIDVLVKNMVSVLGMSNANFAFLPSIVITFVAFVLIIGVATLICVSKSNKIKPSQAIRYGEPEQKKAKKKNRVQLKNFPTSSVVTMLSVKNLVDNFRQVIVIGFCALVTCLMLTFSYTCIESYENALSDPGLIGWDWSEATITNSGKTAISNDEIKELLEDEEDVQCVLPLNVLMNSTFMIDDDVSKTVPGYAYDGDMDLVKVENVEGRNPQKKNEISLSEALCEMLEVEVGDVIKANIEGHESEYEVTGVFFTMNNGGYLFRIQQSSVVDLSMGLQTMFQVKLNDDVQLEEFIDHLEKEYPEEIDIQNNHTFVNDFFDSMMSLIQLIASMICILVVIICFITIFNTNAMDIFNMRKTFGIYKSFGMTSKQIRNIQLVKVSVITIVGSMLGIVIGVSVTDILLKPILMSEGFTNFGLVINWGRLCVNIPICLVVTTISTCLSSRKIKVISVRELVTE